MNKLLKSLKAREIYLLIASFLLLILFGVGILLSSTYNAYKISVKNLDKERSDYEYVFKKSYPLTQTNKQTNIDLALVNKIILSNKSYKDISNVSLEEADMLVISFSSIDLGIAILLAEEIINSSSMSILTIESNRVDEGVTIKLSFI
ncbi:hypothetical protein N8819_04160 [Gammaproteobacteria bacterium]|nr:hypothetical protein [Gammaproteobacteria bacterium]MDA8867670.1 hypothetical protein [Gammaproteobacteria bacterium]MDA9002918.1 hypothetical protein [bacterium]MDA9045812.1 hypothetical protein [Gammaproteobacteria bacterium]